MAPPPVIDANASSAVGSVAPALQSNALSVVASVAILQVALGLVLIAGAYILHTRRVKGIEPQQLFTIASLLLALLGAIALAGGTAVLVNILTGAYAAPASALAR